MDNNKNQKPIRKVLITPDNYYGLEEWYMNVFSCPKCGVKNPIRRTNFCRGCGVSVKMSQTVSDYDKIK